MPSQPDPLKFKLLVQSEDKERLSGLIRDNRLGEIVEELEHATTIVIALDYQGDGMSPVDSHPGLSYLYALKVAARHKQQILLLTDCVFEGLSADELPAKCIDRSVFEKCREEFLAFIKESPNTEKETENLATFVKWLQAIRSEGRRSQAATRSLDNRLTDLPWNVLVIDNEILEGDDLLPSLCRVLGYPEPGFFDRINPIPYYPKQLINHDLDIDEFLIDLRYAINAHDIDLILLDTFLDFPMSKKGGATSERRYGFNFIDLIEKQCLLLQRHPIPVIAMTSYDEDFAAIVESLHRGARWFCSKKDRTSESWVGNLPRILDEIYSLEPGKREYLEKFLPTCSGDVQLLIKEFLTTKEPRFSRLPMNRLDLRDPFFQDADERRSLDIIAGACRSDREQKYDLSKFWEYHYIFHKLFSRYDRIKILQKSDKGFSGTDVFYVIPYADDVEYSVHIVKIGARDLLELEASNFQEWINGMLDSFIGRIKGKPVVADAYAGLLYITVGIKDDYLRGQRPISLREIIFASLEGKPFRNQKTEWTDVVEFIQTLFSNVLSSFYRCNGANDNREVSKLISTYLEELPVALKTEFLNFHSAGKNDLDLDGLEMLARAEQRVQSGAKIVFSDFEVSEIDRIGKKIKLTNRHHFLPKERRPYLWSTSEQELNLAGLKNKVDLRVEVDLADQPEGISLLADPRLVRGKRLTVKTEYLCSAWDDPKINFMNDRNLKSGLQISCRKYLAEKTISSFFEDNRPAGLANPATTLFATGSNGVPKYWLFEQFRELLSSGVLTAPRMMTFSHIHGDLNLENILLTKSGGKLLGWVIDFAKARRGHSAFDFIKIETELKTQVVAHYFGELINLLNLIGLNSDAATKICLNWFVEFEKTGSFDPKVEVDGQVIDSSVFSGTTAKIAKVFQLILEIRRLASTYNFGTEYNWGLLLYSLTIMKFKNLDEADHSPLPKVLAYLSGCVSLLKLRKSDLYLNAGGDFPKIRDLSDIVRNINSTETQLTESITEYLRICSSSAENAPWLTEFLEFVNLRKLPSAFADEEWESTVDLTVALAKAIGSTGTRFDLIPDWADSGLIAVDSPSTGGSGNKLPIILPPLVIATARYAGMNNLVIPKVSTRGIPGGTIDILESVGYKADISLDHYVSMIRDKGIRYSNIAPTHDLAPADAVLMKERKRIGAMRHPLLVVASILGKKLATRCSKLLVEVKSGQESKMRFPNIDETAAVELGSMLFVEVGRRLGMDVTCVITDGDRPQGKFVGNYMALIEVASVLQGKRSNGNLPFDEGFTEQAVRFSLELLNISSSGRLFTKADIDRSISSGDAFRLFLRQLEKQGVSSADTHKLRNSVTIESISADGGFANETFKIFADQSGLVSAIDVEAIDESAKILIAPKKKILDYEAGIVLTKQVGESIAKGDLLALAKGNDSTSLRKAGQFIRQAITIEPNGDADLNQSYLRTKICFEENEIRFYDWRQADWQPRGQ